MLPGSILQVEQLLNVTIFHSPRQFDKFKFFDLWCPEVHDM